MALVAGGIAIASGRAWGKDEDMQVDLSVNWSAEPGQLRARYRLTNGGAGRVLVFDRLFHTAPSGVRTVDPALAWRWQEPDGTYLVVKYVPRVPQGTRVEIPELPYARWLNPGAVLEGEAAVPVPADVLRPYQEKPAPGSVASVGRTALVIGVAAEDDEIRLTPVKGEEGVFSVAFDWAEPRQRLIWSPVLEAAVPMRQ